MSLGIDKDESVESLERNPPNEWEEENVEELNVSNLVIKVIGFIYIKSTNY